MAQSSFAFDSETTKQELASKGYSVVPEVLTPKECDEVIGQYKTWLGTFEKGDFPKQRKSLIYQYRIGHYEATWSARLKVKPVFASVWDTEKLFTSFDSVAISKPPEETGGPFDTGTNWFHCDQRATKLGLHCYQGALYLEESTVNDHCLRVLAKSHRYHEEFFGHFAGARKKSLKMEFCRLNKAQVDWYKKRGCDEVKVHVPKGGVVLWDSRTIHDNVPPVFGRRHSDRWRWVVFICMAPAKWASPEDKAERAHAHQELLMTNHWPSQNVALMTSKQRKHNGQYKLCIDNIPEVGNSPGARLLSAVDEYDFDDGESNGPDWTPTYDTTED